MTDEKMQFLVFTIPLLCIVGIAHVVQWMITKGGVR